MRIGILLGCVWLTACSSFSHTNVESPDFATNENQLSCAPGMSENARRRLVDKRGASDVLVVLAASGGGSRAAYFAGSAMLAMNELAVSDQNLLDEVDMMSAVSGGSLATAYYAASDDGTDAEGRLPWQEDVVRDLLAQSYLSRWIGSWFLPLNVAKFWFTAFDRTDQMAVVINDGLFADGVTGQLSFGALNPERPNLILNSTRIDRNGFADRFTFTHEDFARICSDLDRYSVPRAVMAAATFPGVFNSMTLQDFRSTAAKSEDRFVHLIDGGLLGNLGLDVPLELLTHEGVPDSIRHTIVISIDSDVAKEGVSDADADTRNPFDFFVDSNIQTGINASLRKINDQTLTAMRELQSDRLTFWHLPLRNKAQQQLPASGTPTGNNKRTLQERLKDIPTSFDLGGPDITKDEARAAIDEAVSLLINEDESCVIRIRQIFAGETDLVDCVSQIQDLF